MERREALGTLLAGAASTALAGTRTDPGRLFEEAPAPKAGGHAIKPLPFDPKKLDGLSEKLLVSHHENNYAGAVKNLNKVEAELARLPKDAAPFLVSSLRERELNFANSLVLHELYFANLGGGGKPSGGLAAALAEAFGSMGAWEESFRALGSSLGGGSGWTVLALNFHTGQLNLAWAGGHTNAMAFGAPLLVMDMFEHAYQMDYGAAAGKYIDAFFRNVAWEEVHRRFEAAGRMAKALKG
ncbi:MAG TPA: Fe-Mn family superoxide dismutase [Holophagaceae bacterium]|nr:Fe-Mn family superoxide dismutase [Holophagaceae bacterium]